ncbi:MAG: Ig-like domain-containing protein [Sideroxydans sp.]|nr:Ig-like domain-containing protein [Sideroxydans sp.]
MQRFKFSAIAGFGSAAYRLIAGSGKISLTGCLAAVLLSSCGGGGNAGLGTVTSNLSFPLQSSLRASTASGESTDFTVSGTCTGSASINSSPATPAMYGNISGVSSMTTLYVSVPNCSPSYIYSSTTNYFDSNYDPLGSVDSSGEYGVFAIPPVIPASVHVGDTGTIGRIDYYSDAAHLFTTSHVEMSYAILPDTATTAFVNLISKSYDIGGVLTATQQDKYRIKSDGSLIPVSLDIQAANGANQHFVLTAVPDTVPPTVLSATPYSYSTNVPTYSPIRATFSESIDPATVNSGVFTVMAGSTPVPGTITYAGNSATFTPSAPLAPTTVYTARISAGVKDLAGNAMSSIYSWQFQTTVADTTPPAVITTSPFANASDVNVGSAITATFSEPINPSTVTLAGAFTVMNGATSVSGTVTYDGATATFTPSAPLANSTLYTVTLTTVVKDLAGNAMGANNSWTFQTLATVTPKVLSTSPDPYAYAVAGSSVINATFSTPIDPATVDNTTFTLVGGTTPVAGTVTYSGTTASFTPSAPLAINTVYRATITAGVKDLAGIAMSANYSWTFQTFSDGSTSGPVNPSPAGLWQPTPGSTPATGNFVYLQSDVGDYIGLGQTYTYTPATAVLTFSENGGLFSVNVNGNTWWYGNFQTGNTVSQLQIGFYPGLQRYPFHNPVFGGLSWYGDGRGCNTEKGWFAVDNVTYVSGVLTAIDLRFEQNCEGGATALHGAIHWGP